MVVAKTLCLSPKKKVNALARHEVMLVLFVLFTLLRPLLLFIVAAVVVVVGGGIAVVAAVAAVVDAAHFRSMFAVGIWFMWLRW